MANWVTFTRKSDKGPIYVNLDTVERMRWNEAEGCTVVLWRGGKDKFVKVLERPEEVLGNGDHHSVPSKKR
jgi:hypothetical protein